MHHCWLLLDIFFVGEQLGGVVARRAHGARTVQSFCNVPSTFTPLQGPHRTTPRVPISAPCGPCWHTRNSIAFGSAPRREVDSQPISPLARPAVSQTEAHSLGFLSVADAAPSSGETFRLRPSSGRMVMQLTGVFMVGGLNPGRVNTAPPPAPPPVPPPTVGRPGFKPPTENFASAALPFDRRWCDSDMPPHCLEPSERKLLTPPPSPPPQKSDIQF